MIMILIPSNSGELLCKLVEIDQFADEICYIEYLGIWETLYNSDFIPLEFEGFKIRGETESGYSFLGNMSEFF